MVRRFQKIVKKTFVYFLIRLIIWIIRSLPRNIALGVCEKLGRIAFAVLNKEREKTIKHLKMAFGKEKNVNEIHTIARNVFMNLGRNLVDTVRVSDMSTEDILSFTKSEGTEHVENALAKGRGGIILSAHAGAWEYLGGFIAAKFGGLHVISKKLYDPRLERILVQSRHKSRYRNLSRGNSSREIIKTLRSNKLLAILIDQDTKVKGIFVDFFGQPAHTATAPAVLSLKYGSSIIPSFIYLDEDNVQHTVFRELISIEPTGDSEEDVRRTTQECSYAIESFIREHPDQWVWMHRRWKTKPPEEITIRDEQPA